MLYERGKFLLNDPIYEYFPEWKHTMVAETQEDGAIRLREAKRPIEVRDCFSMAMGIGYGGPEYTHQMMEKSRAQLAASIGDYTLTPRWFPKAILLTASAIPFASAAYAEITRPALMSS